MELFQKGKYLLFGDNHINSKDSRVFGFVDEKDILGIVKV
ncbi:MAG: S26 family signal peptidase [Acholeplasmatales bacterium]